VVHLLLAAMNNDWRLVTDQADLLPAVANAKGKTQEELDAADAAADAEAGITDDPDDPEEPEEPEDPGDQDDRDTPVIGFRPPDDTGPDGPDAIDDVDVEDDDTTIYEM